MYINWTKLILLLFCSLILEYYNYYYKFVYLKKLTFGSSFQYSIPLLRQAQLLCLYNGHAVCNFNKAILFVFDIVYVT